MGLQIIPFHGLMLCTCQLFIANFRVLHSYYSVCLFTVQLSIVFSNLVTCPVNSHKQSRFCKRLSGWPWLIRWNRSVRQIGTCYHQRPGALEQSPHWNGDPQLPCWSESVGTRGFLVPWYRIFLDFSYFSSCQGSILRSMLRDVPVADLRIFTRDCGVA